MITKKTDLAAELKERLGNREETWKSIGTGSGISVTLLIHFRQGKKQLSLEYLMKLADYLGVRYRLEGGKK